jgi:hypothetical protein
VPCQNGHSVTECAFWIMNRRLGLNFFLVLYMSPGPGVGLWLFAVYPPSNGHDEMLLSTPSRKIRMPLSRM